MIVIQKYFPGLTRDQIFSFEKMIPLYHAWNKETSIISRKEMDSLYENYILHSLAIAKIVSFSPGSEILDVGTGAGFPGIPLAIMFPACHFVLIDSIKKRIKVVNAIAEELALDNVTAMVSRVEDLYDQFDFVVARAVTSFPAFVGLVDKNISQRRQNNLPNGILYLKAGDFQEEIQSFKPVVEVSEITKFFNEPFFNTKKVVYLPVNK